MIDFSPRLTEDLGNQPGIHQCEGHLDCIHEVGMPTVGGTMLCLGAWTVYMQAGGLSSQVSSLLSDSCHGCAVSSCFT